MVIWLKTEKYSKYYIDSYAPGIQKGNVIKFLVQRALKICRDTEQSSELDFITDTLKINEFPMKLTKGQIEKLKHQENHNNPLSQQ